MRNPEKTEPYGTTYHRDGTVTIWNVYTQTWQRLRATTAYDDDALMASLSASERARIGRMAGRLGA